MDSASSPASATPPATGDDCFPMKKRMLMQDVKQTDQSTVETTLVDRPVKRSKRVPPSISKENKVDPAMDMDSTSPPASAQPLSTRDDCVLPNKRTRLQYEQPVQNCDWINTLPDDILIKILSLLTISEAAMTGCVSTRWRHLWKNVDSLILDAHNLRMQGLHGRSKLKEPSKLNMTWPADLTFPRLYNIEINGSSGEPELMELLYFLLRRASMLKWLQLKTLAMEPWFVRKERHKLQDERPRYLEVVACYDGQILIL